MKPQHRRRAPYRPRLEFAIGLIALAVCGLGIGLVTADVLEKRPVPISTQATTTQAPTTTTIAMGPLSVIETTTTTVTAPQRKPIMRPVAAHSAPSTVAETTTTTTEAPKTPLKVAQSQVGKTGPYADGGFYCAKFVSWVAEQAKIEGWQSSDSPARLHKIAMDEGRIVAEPYPAVMVFIDLTGQNFANQYISHVGIVESVNGDEFVSIEGNADSSGLVTRQTRRVGDGFVIAFAGFDTKGAP